jgi:hypothetical protein
MAATQTELAGPVSSYARRFHDIVGSGHQVASPLGAWLVLALTAPASAGQDRAVLTEVLGCDVDAAARIAAELLTHPHPLVAAAAAVWNRPGMVSAQWLAGLPAVVQRGNVPDQAELDSWARHHTFGLIDSFPIKIDPTVYLILATALATKVSWEQPFTLAPASSLGGTSPWARQLTSVLRTPAHGHVQFIAVTPEAGDVAVHMARARGGLLVMSVAAAPQLAAADVLAVAYRLAVAQALGDPIEQRSLFDLPLGEDLLWSVQETSRGHEAERCTTVLPAWSARSTHDLTDPGFGFAAAASALGGGDPWQAKQAAMARYSRIGFEAAAVTAMAISLSMLAPGGGLARTAELRFGHPFAVVAVTVDEPKQQTADRAAHGPWHGVPAFSAWVTEPQDAT